jgi:hypothetical protein
MRSCPSDASPARECRLAEGRLAARVSLISYSIQHLPHRRPVPNLVLSAKGGLGPRTDLIGYSAPVISGPRHMESASMLKTGRSPGVFINPPFKTPVYSLAQSIHRSCDSAGERSGPMGSGLRAGCSCSVAGSCQPINRNLVEGMTSAAAWRLAGPQTAEAPLRAQKLRGVTSNKMPEVR